MIQISKRICAFCAAAVLAVCLGGCAKPGTKPHTQVDPLEGISQPFESTAVIRYKGIEATAKIAREAPGYCKITFQNPEALQDMAVEFTVDQVNLHYKQLQASFNPNTIPGTAAAKLMVSAFNAAARDSGVSVDYQDDALILSGQMEGGTFVMKLDPKNGNLASLSVPEDDFEASFSDFTILAQ